MLQITPSRRDDQYDVVKNDQRCSSFSTSSSSILLMYKDSSSVLAGKEQCLSVRVCLMNSYIDNEELSETNTPVLTMETEPDSLSRCGFSSDEITALLWLRQWFQTRGSDRVQIVRHLEFFKYLVLNGRLAL
jgi:hypothetical protein